MSEIYRIEETIKTPEIVMDPEQGLICIKGRSLPEDAIEFYSPIINHIRKSADEKDFYTIRFSLEYVNTSSASVIRSIMEFFFEKKNKDGTDFLVEWCYEEDDFEMEETGRHYEQTIPGIPFKFIEVQSL